MTHKEVDPPQTVASLFIVCPWVPVSLVSLPVSCARPVLILSCGQKLVLLLADLRSQRVVNGVNDVYYSDEGSIACYDRDPPWQVR